MLDDNAHADRTRKLLADFENKAPEIVFEWTDAETGARGWAVINSLRGGAAGGGTRMRKGLDRREVESLAKTMEVKFTISGPAIGGAKSGIDFDPADPRRREVLERWFSAVSPLLKSYYGTGGDLNVDELHDVIPITEAHGLWHPQEGVVVGHFRPTVSEQIQKVGQLRLGVAKIVEDPHFSPDTGRRYSVADLITGWGVAESVRHYYGVYGGDLRGKRAVVQGWGNVGSAAAYYLAQAGARIVGVIDRDGGLLAPDGLGFAEVRSLFLDKVGNTLSSPQAVAFGEADARVWDLGAEIFLPCAASRLVTREQIDRMIAGGLEVISCGANVPFRDPEIFYGPTYEYADAQVSVVPDFIANCGMARVFALLMNKDVEISDRTIFEDVSDTIRCALADCHQRSSGKTGLAATGFELALAQLV
ncbi:MAG: Glu/Leu/Phe/Val dehydrogenase dimerization domain-containing protein [Amaricoccus sp.]